MIFARELGELQRIYELQMILMRNQESYKGFLRAAGGRDARAAGGREGCADVSGEGCAVENAAEHQSPENGGVWAPTPQGNRRNELQMVLIMNLKNYKGL